MGDPGKVRELVALLRASSEALEVVIDGLDGEALGSGSYAKDWSIAQVLSHLGSGAEIFSLILEAAAAGTEPPAWERFAEVWAVWDKRTDEEKSASYAEANGALLEQLVGYDDETLAGISLDLFGSQRDAADIVGMRLSEHVVHSWDVAVARDPSAELLAEAVPHLVGALTGMAGRVRPPEGVELHVRVRTTSPAHELSLVVGEKVELAPADEGAPAVAGGTSLLQLPAAAFVRLLYGRLDPDHTPEGTVTEGIELDELRAVFPGF